MKVTLLTNTQDMVQTLWTIWQLSRTNDSLKDIALHYFSAAHPTDSKAFFERIINEDIPLAEMIDFIFVLEDIPISLREQLVRHRIGVKVGGQYYVDTIPDLSDSSFWSQSMRVMDMSSFEFFVPDSIANSIPYIVESGKRNQKIPEAVYGDAMDNAARAYSALVEAGIPREDARNVIPLGATHRIVWKLNLSAIKHIVSKRSCWILQLGLWKPVIQGIISELCKLNSGFRQLATPPCMKGNKFRECLFTENNFARLEGDVDMLPPCPLYLNYHRGASLACVNKVFPKSKTCWFWRSDILAWECCDESRMPLTKQMRAEYAKFWNRNVDTGEML